MLPMRLFEHRGYWYVYHKGKKRSLGTKDKRLAKGIFRDLQREYLYREAQKVDQDSAVSLSEYLDYYNAAADRQDLSSYTPKNINSAFHSLIKYVGDIPISSVTKEVIDRFKLDAQPELKPTSINSYIINISAAMAYAVKNGIIQDAPIFTRIKVGKRQRRVIMQDDLDKILEAADPELQRVIHVALWTGCRLSEITAMRYEHKTGQVIRVIGKGNKERIIPLVGKAKEILSQQDIGRVFTRWTLPRSLSRAFKTVADKAGVKARFHDLRHTAATNMLAKGMMLSAVQRVLGHEAISTTQIYADILEETLMAEMVKMEEK